MKSNESLVNGVEIVGVVTILLLQTTPPQSQEKRPRGLV